MTTCTDVVTCLADGSVECHPASDTCPPCLYKIAGGDISCYRRENGECPFAGQFAECDTPVPRRNTSDNNSDDTRKQSKETNDGTPSKAPDASTPDTTSSKNTEARSNDSLMKTHADSPLATTPTAPSDSVILIQSSNTTTGDAFNSTSLPHMMTNTEADSSSSQTANIGILIAAVVLALILIAFVAYRMAKKKKKLDHKLKTTGSTLASQRSNETRCSGASSESMYSTYSYTNGKDEDISMLSGSQASSTYEQEYNEQPIRKGISPRIAANVPNYGGQQSQLSENSQYSSVSTGQHHYGYNVMPLLSGKAGEHFVNVTASSENQMPLDLGSLEPGELEDPLTVSQLMATGVGGKYKKKKAYSPRQNKPGPLQYGHVKPTAFDSAIPPNDKRPPKVYGHSAGNSTRSDYDIVGPATMREVVSRNSEMLANDSRYSKFSLDSEAYMMDESSSDDEHSDSDEEQRV